MRCCYRSSLLAVATALAVCGRAAADQVLVVGAQKDLIHESIATKSTPASLSTALTAEGLASLAMGAHGFATGSIVRVSSGNAASVDPIVAQSPVQADVFNLVNAYALVYVDPSDKELLKTVNDAATAGYHKVFDLQEGGGVSKIPKVLARELGKTTTNAEILCAGSEILCARNALPSLPVSTDELENVWKDNAFLARDCEASQKFVTELAQTAKITQAIASKKDTSSGLYIVSLSSVNALSDDKRQAALDAISKQLTRLLVALQTASPSASGAQIIATEHSVVRALDSTVAYSRKLLSFKEGVTGSDDDDDDDDSGSADDANATVSDVTMQDIAEYQIVLWTSVLLGAVLLLVIIAMCNMEPKRDSLLYAKFTTSNAGRKFD